jgi:hypothetical protein
MKNGSVLLLDEARYKDMQLVPLEPSLSRNERGNMKHIIAYLNLMHVDSQIIRILNKQ